MFYQDKATVNSKRIVYTPSGFAKKALLFLQEVGQLQALKPHTSNRSKLSSFLFFIVLEGNGTLNYNNKQYNLEQGDCIFIDCYKPYSHTTTNKLWKLQWVHFDGNSLTDIYNKYLERGGQAVFKPSNTDDYSNLIANLYDIANSEDYLKDMKINEQLATLLTKIMENSWHPQQQTYGKSSGTLKDVKSYLDSHWQEKIVLEELADKFYINKFYLARLFKNQYGSSIINYITNLRITNSKKMLRFTDKKIDQISKECGFDDSNYFTRAFKKIESISPTEYRRMWSK